MEQDKLIYNLQHHHLRLNHYLQHHRLQLLNILLLLNLLVGYILVLLLLHCFKVAGQLRNLLTLLFKLLVVEFCLLLSSSSLVCAGSIGQSNRNLLGNKT